MTRSDYLAKLDKYLKKLPKDDYQEAMDYFREYFDEAGPENEEAVIAELGSPKDAAHDIISRLLDEKIVEDEKSPKNKAIIIWIAILAILASPVALPLILALLMVIITILTFGIAIIAMVLALGVALLTSGVYMLIDSWSYLSIAPSTTALGLGLGLLSLGLALLALLAAGAVGKFAVKSIGKLIQKAASKRRKS